MKKSLSLLLLCMILLLAALPAAQAEEEEPSPTPEPTPMVLTIEEDTASVEEQELIDRDGIKITLKSLDFSGFYGPTLHLLVENDTEAEITVEIVSSAVNGAMIRSLFSCDVMPGKKANAELGFLREELERAGIARISDIELRFHAFDAASWETLFYSNPVRFETSDGDFEQVFDDSGLEIVNKGKVRVVAQKLVQDENAGSLVRLFIENRSDMNITVTLQDVSVNEYMMDPEFTCDVLAGRVAYADVVFLEHEIEKNDIGRIAFMEAVFHVCETSTWYTIAHTDPVLIDFNALPVN